MATGTNGARQGWTPSGRCTIFCCDVIAFGNPDRVDHIQRHLRHELYTRLRRAFDDSGVAFDGCYREDRGDGAILIPPRGTPATTLLSPMAELLDAELRRQNEVASSVARIRLRVALHMGEVHRDDHGISGTAVNHTFRILEAPAFKSKVNDSAARLAVIVSEQLYEEVVRHALGLIDPADYERVDIESKETRTTGWMRLLGVPRPAQSDVTLPGQNSKVEPWADRHPGIDVPVRGYSSPYIFADDLFEIVEELLNLQLMATEHGRDQVVRALREDISRMIPRQREPRLDTYCIVQTCLEHPRGLQELLGTIRRFAGGPVSLERVEQIVTRLLP